MGKKYFYCKTDKHPISYKVGEKMIYNLELREDGQPITCHTFSYIIQRDYEEKIEGTASGLTGTLTLETVMNKPGFAYIICQALDEHGNKLEDCEDFNGGTGAEVETLGTTTPMPSAFHEFWDGCKNELYSVEPTVLDCQKIEVPEHPDFDVYEVQVACAGPMPVCGYLSIPKKDGQFPAYVCYKGYGVVPAPISCREDTIIFYINAHGFPNGKPEEFYKNLAQTTLKNYGLLKEQNEKPENSYFKYMAIRAAQAARFVQTEAKFNGELVLSGGSQGAFQATAASTMVPEVKLIDILVPWLCDINACSIGRLRFSDPEYVDGITYYDLTNLATRLHCPVKLLAGLGDYTCAPTGIFSFYNAITTPKEMVVVQNKTHIDQSPEAETFQVLYP